MRTQWEYMTIWDAGPYPPKFNELGLQGWEVCGIFTSPSVPGGSVITHVALLKRPLLSKPADSGDECTCTASGKSMGCMLHGMGG